MEIIQTIFIGAIQGISEFLPISSSGHLVLVPYFFGWQYQGLSFDVALHFGTAIAIIIYFWNDWIGIIRSAVSGKKLAEVPTANSSSESEPEGSSLRVKNQLPTVCYPPNLLWQIAVATIPAVIFGILLMDYEETVFRSPTLIAYNLIIFGILLFFIDKYSSKSRDIDKINYKQSFLIGCAQAIALIPGVSRSGITIAAGRAAKFDRKSAARFSFLLSTPAILGATVFSLKDIVYSNLNTAFWASVLSSAIFGFLTIKFLLKFLEKSNFNIFVWYRIIIAGIILLII